jgi:hypothetical protein
MTRRKNQFVNSRGEIIDTDSDICPDGCGISTKMMMLDGLDDTQRRIATDAAIRATPVLHRPGTLRITDADRDARSSLIDERQRAVSDAWKNPPTVKDADTARDYPESDVDANGNTTDLYEARKQRASNAWRTLR